MVMRSKLVMKTVTLCLTCRSVKRRTTEKMMIRIAGPAANALIRNRGAKMGEFQKGLLERPESKNAVTVWILTAQGIEM